MPLLWLAAPFAVGTAIYTAFLFAQAEGRDLWQSPLLAPHLLVQALLAGAALLAIYWGFGSATEPLRPSLLQLLGWLLVADLALLAAEYTRPHATDEAKVAAAAITHGRYARLFRLGVVVAGHLVPLALCFVGAAISNVLAGCLALAGLAAYEWIFVRAPQEVPNS